MGSLERVWEVSGVSGRSLGGISIDVPGSGVLEACLGGLWGFWGSLGSISIQIPGSGILEACLRGLSGISGGLLEVSGRHLGDLWEDSLQGGAPRRIWEVLGSKSGATLS